MAKFTSLEFMEALGLGYFDYNGAKILLRCLATKGIAKAVGKIRPTGKGRPQVVYELPDEITLKFPAPQNTPLHPPKKKKIKDEENVVQEEDTVMVQEETDSVHDPVASESREFVWDDGWEDD